jgi:hypothetical protein
VAPSNLVFTAFVQPDSFPSHWLNSAIPLIKESIMKIALLSLVVAHALASMVSAADWYQIPLSTFNKTEAKNWGNGVIISLERPFPNWNKTASVERLRTGSDQYTDPVQVLRVDLDPPNGEENRWLSMVLSGQASGRSLWVYADKNGNNVLISPSGAEMRMMLE